MGDNNNLSLFAKKVLIILGLTALSMLFAGVLFYALDFLLLLFAAILLAVIFRHFGLWISDFFNIPENYATGLGIVLIFGIVFLFFFFGVSIVRNQISEFMRIFPASLNKLMQFLSQYEIVSRNIENFSQRDLIQNTQMLIGKSTLFLTSFFGVVSSIFIAIIIAVFLAVSPEPYLNGFLSLVPNSQKGRARDILNKMATSLNGWITGTFVDMALVAVLTTAGLLILQVPMAIFLGLFAGAVTFIPTIGPIIGAVPSILVGFAQSPQKALYITILYVVVQVVESNFMMPFVMRRTLQLPPALILVTQVLFGILAGFLGLALAVPILTSLIVLIKELYIKDVIQKRKM